MFIISHLPPNLIRLLRVCLNLGKANDTMDSFKISMTITEPHITFVQFHNLTLGKVFLFLANCGAFVQCFRTGINVQPKILKA